MPEPLLYVKAVLVAAVACVVFILAVVLARRPPGPAWWNIACVVALGIGLSCGFAVSALQISWPPRNALERLLTTVFPALLAIELVAGFSRVPKWLAWLSRICLALALPRILLHGSVYLRFDEGDWTALQATAVILSTGGLIVSVWSLLSWLSRRSPSVSLPISLGMAIQCAGICVMLAGYIKGGAAAFPLFGTIVAVAIATTLIDRRRPVKTDVGHTPILGIGVVGLFGLLFIGRFFGRLSTTSAITMALAPLLCWVTELPWLKNRKPWVVGSIRLAVVSVPLIVVLIAAKREFDQNMAPLLGQRNARRLEQTMTPTGPPDILSLDTSYAIIESGKSH